MATYLQEHLTDRNDDPLRWWQANSMRLPALGNLSRKFLSAPPSSVDSERVFSTAGNVVEDKRSRLTVDNVEKLVFLNKNLSLVDYEY